jgi:inhibitor of cysteine peptidase
MSIKKETYLVITLAVLIVSLAAIPLSIYLGARGAYEVDSLKQFASYAELKEFVKSNMEYANRWYANLYYALPVSGVFSGVRSTMDAMKAGLSPPTPSYSGTNVQVTGVDEGDIVKNDGNFIYLIRGGWYSQGQEVDIIKAYPPEEAAVVARLKWAEGVIPVELFINGDKMTVFLTENGYKYTPESFWMPKLRVEVYNIQDRTSPVLARNVTVDGGYVSSRMIGSYVYVVTTSPAYLYKDEITLPSIQVGNDVLNTSANNVYYSPTFDVSYTFTTVFSFNIHNDQQPVVSKTVLLGSTSVIYVSAHNIYLAITSWGVPTATLKMGITATNPGSEQTLLERVHIEDGDITFAAEGSVPGYLLNQFSLDEYQGYLRVATTTGPAFTMSEQNQQTNHIYVLDNSLRLVGTLDDIAPGERIYSVRFSGDKCYVVTFKKVDPFFVIDLRNPVKPTVLGWLKIPGYSNYMQPYDASHIIGIGKEAVDAEEGDFAWYQGIKVSFFDVTNVSAPTEMSKYIVGERGSDSPVLTDHKALLLDPSKDLMVLPVLVAEIDRSKYPGTVPPYAYGEPVWQGVYVFSVSPQDGILLKGTITHLNGLSHYGNLDSAKFIQRSLYIGGYLYTLSDDIVKINDLSSLKEVRTLVLS